MIYSGSPDRKCIVQITAQMFRSKIKFDKLLNQTKSPTHTQIILKALGKDCVYTCTHINSHGKSQKTRKSGTLRIKHLVYLHVSHFIIFILHNLRPHREFERRGCSHITPAKIRGSSPLRQQWSAFAWSRPLQYYNFRHRLFCIIIVYLLGSSRIRIFLIIASLLLSLPSFVTL